MVATASLFYRQTMGKGQEGWSLELRRNLKDRPGDVMKDTDIIERWQDRAVLFPTLAQIALDILPCQASSVPCERLLV
jgi:hAT family C-terminal dimerisation region